MFPLVIILLCVLSVGVDIGIGSDSVCSRHSSAHRIKSFESLASQSSLGRSSKLLSNQFRSLVSNTGVRTLNQPQWLSIKIFIYMCVTSTLPKLGVNKIIKMFWKKCLILTRAAFICLKIQEKQWYVKYCARSARSSHTRTKVPVSCQGTYPW